MIRLVVPEMGNAEFDAIRKVLDSGYLVQGSNVRRFEKSVANYLGIPHVVAVSSGTAALHLAVMVLGLGPGDEVIVPDFTFPATANVVVQVGARPVFADVSLKTFNIDPAQVIALITPNTRAILPVHLFGLPAAMDEILAVAQRHSLWVIEDAACALGATYNDQKCGTMGLMGCFSLHPRKAITTGEGGLIATGDDAVAGRLRSLRNHGMVAGPGGHEFIAPGLNYRLTDFQGALGVVQLERLDQILRTRQRLAAMYDAALAGVPWLQRPLFPGAPGNGRTPSGSQHIYQSYVTLLDEGLDRPWIMAALREMGVECTIGTYACHAQPFFQERYGYRPGDLPNSYLAFQRALTLPLHSRMSMQDVELVVQALRRAVP
jgi:perosamine synthetase